MKSKVIIALVALSLFAPNLSSAQERGLISSLMCRFASVFTGDSCSNRTASPTSSIPDEASVEADLIDDSIDAGGAGVPSSGLTRAEVQSMIDGSVSKASQQGVTQVVTVPSEPVTRETVVYRSSSAQNDAIVDRGSRAITALVSDIEEGRVAIPASSLSGAATTTSFFSSVGRFASGVIDTLSSTAASIVSLLVDNLVATNATSTNLYVGTLQLGTTLAVSSGGTGAVTASGARSNLGLSYATDGDILDTQVIGAWGDSLTAGAGGATSYPTRLATLSGATVYNGGAGGQSSTQIGVRQGGVQGTVTVTGDEIPASGGVTVTFPAGYEPVTTQGPQTAYVTIEGVYGIISRSGSVYTFTRSASGSIVSVPGSVPFTVDTFGRNEGGVVIWAGRNNSGDGAQVKEDIADMVASLGHERYLILGILNGGTEIVGTGTYVSITQLNDELAAIYGNHFIDMRSYLVSQYDSGIAQDVIDHDNDVPPTSLRSDNIHLNTAGYLKVADRVYEDIEVLLPSQSVVLVPDNIPAIMTSGFANPGIFGSTTPNIGYFSQVGIGTQSPISKLHVKNAVSQTLFTGTTTLGLVLEGLGASYTGLDFSNSGGSGASLPKARIAMVEDGTGSYLRFGTTYNWSGGITNTALTINPSGNVGIGTTSPAATLSVANNSSALAGANFTNINPAGYSGLNVTDNSSNVTGSFVYSNASAAVNPSSVWLGSRTAVPLHLVTGGATPRLTVTATGSVGIGTTNPGSKLSVSGGAISGETALGVSGSAAGLGLYHGNGAQNDSLDLRMYARASTSAAWSGLTSVGTAGPNTDLRFVTSVGGAPTVKMTLSDSGNLGIGTTSPSQRLSVEGGASFSGDVTATGTVMSTGTVTSFRASSTNPRMVFADTNAISGGRITDFITSDNGGSPQFKMRFLSDNETSAVSDVLTFTRSGGSANLSSMVLVQGNLGVGSSSPSSKLSVQGSIQSSDLLGGVTTLSVDANGNIIRTPSDEALKENIQSLSATTSLDRLLRLRGVSYEWRDKEKYGSATDIGFVAQEVELVVPEVVKSGGQYKSLNYGSLVALVVEAVRELSAKVDGLVSSNFTYVNEASIGVLNVGKVNIQGDVCVDNVCVTKDQFKSIFMQNGATVYSAEHYQASTPAPDPEPASGTDLVSSSTPADIIEETASSTPVEEMAPVTPDATTEEVPAPEGVEDSSVVEEPVTAPTE